MFYNTLNLSQHEPDSPSITVSGAILHTPGHSNYSIFLFLDDGFVFIGDLTHPAFIGKEDPAVVAISWHLLQERGAQGMSQCGNFGFLLKQYFETDVARTRN